MLFNSYEFLFLFLPLAWVGYFFLHHRKRHGTAAFWLLIASLAFYAYWNPIFLPLLLGSIVVNYGIGYALSRMPHGLPRRATLIGGIALNLALLGYFKYADFFIESVNSAAGTSFGLLHLLLPLGISFFTFTQIAFLVDAARGIAHEYGFVRYALFVTFFPHLIAGPVLHHAEMMPQFADPSTWSPRARNIALGLFVLSVGLFTKVLIADSLAPWANAGFDSGQTLSLIEAWCASIAFSLQLYFDFSAYSDMAIGLALLFNIRFPQNFDSPYKSRSLQEFWRRWHITLSRFLRDYLYIPLGGSRKGDGHTMTNLLIVFGLGGLWHGAGWTFVVWGLLNGAGLIVGHLWGRTKLSLGPFVSQALTLLFVNAAWVFFRAPSMDRALDILASMVGANGIALPVSFASVLPALPGVSFASLFGWAGVGHPVTLFALILVGIALCLFAPNAAQLAERFKPTRLWLLMSLGLLISALLNMNRVSEFIYFNF